ncbi:MAG: AAA family ATPase [Anaerolineae bacterium]
MLTRIEANGYKSFDPDAGINLSLSPFTVVVGPNNSGKSNLFDLLQFVSNLSHESFKDAFTKHRGDPGDAFWAGYEPGPRQMGVKLTFDGGTVSGNIGKIPVSGAEYKLYLEFDPRRRRLRSVGENLTILTDGDKPAWWSIETEFDRNRGDGNVLVRSGPERLTLETEYRLEHMERTALSQVQDSHYGFVLDVRRALSSWRIFHLNPQAIRSPSPSISSWDLESNGAGLATVLATLERESEFQPEYRKRFQAIQRELHRAIPALTGVHVKDSGDGRLVLTFEQDGQVVPARVVSDGTLRVLALLTLAYSPEPPALIALEEPENGIHPHLLDFVINMLRGISRRKQDPVQVLLNSHSPYLVDLAEPHELVQARMIDGATRFAPVSLEDRPALRELLEQGTYTLGEVYASGSLVP